MSKKDKSQNHEAKNAPQPDPQNAGNNPLPGAANEGGNSKEAGYIAQTNIRNGAKLYKKGDAVPAEALGSDLQPLLDSGYLAPS